MRDYLSEAGRADQPFEIIIALYEPPSPAVAERAAKLGVTGLMCVPWMGGLRDDNTEVATANRGTALERKIEATYAFAESVIKPLAG
jgi:hypothetical protein